MPSFLPAMLLIVASNLSNPSVPCSCGPDLSGAWTAGRWESLADGHFGPLTATFQRTKANQYDVTFRGRFFRFIPFRYKVSLDVVAIHGDRVCLAGSSRLPIFGTYHYTAEATACSFRAEYTSGSDHGTFTLQR